MSTKPVPQIDGEALAAALRRAAEASPGHPDSGPTMSSELAAYQARLVVALRAAHEMPASVDSLYVAHLSFFMAADGSISAVRLLKTSGNSDYDRSVLAAFAKVRSVGAVPGGLSDTYVIDFKMTE